MEDLDIIETLQEEEPAEEETSEESETSESMAKRKEYPYPKLSQFSDDILIDELAKRKKPKDEDEELSADDIEELKEKFIVFRAKYLKKHPGASMAEVKKAYKKLSSDFDLIEELKKKKEKEPEEEAKKEKYPEEDKKKEKYPEEEQKKKEYPYPEKQQKKPSIAPNIGKEKSSGIASKLVGLSEEFQKKLQQLEEDVQLIKNKGVKYTRQPEELSEKTGSKRTYMMDRDGSIASWE